MITGRMNERTTREAVAMFAGSIALLAAGLYFIFGRYEPAITAAYARSEMLYAKTVSNERALAQAGHLRRLEQNAQADIARVSKRDAPAIATADFITLLHASAQAFGTRVLAIEPGLADRSGPTSHARPLTAVPLTIKLQGSFKRLLRFVSNLPHHHTLVRILDTQFALSGVKHDSHSEPLLDAVLHVELYRVGAIPGNRS